MNNSIYFLLTSDFLDIYLMYLSALSCSDLSLLRSLFLCLSWYYPSSSCLINWLFMLSSSRAFLLAIYATSFLLIFSASIYLAIYCIFLSFYCSFLINSRLELAISSLRFCSSTKARSYYWYFLRAYSSTPTLFLFYFYSSSLNAYNYYSSIWIPPSIYLFFLSRLSLCLFIYSHTCWAFLFYSYNLLS